MCVCVCVCVRARGGERGAEGRCVCVCGRAGGCGVGWGGGPAGSGRGCVRDHWAAAATPWMVPAASCLLDSLQATIGPERMCPLRLCSNKPGPPPLVPAASGPGDVLLQADKLWQQGAMLYQVGVAAALRVRLLPLDGGGHPGSGHLDAGHVHPLWQALAEPTKQQGIDVVQATRSNCYPLCAVFYWNRVQIRPSLPLSTSRGADEDAAAGAPGRGVPAVAPGWRGWPPAPLPRARHR